MEKYSVRSLCKEDIPTVVKIALQSTFQPSTASIETWIKHDPDGIKVAVLDTGEVIGVCAAVNHNETFCFGGTFCVYEKYRQLDIGHNLYVACFEHAGERNIGLNCSQGMVNSYKRRGFGVMENLWSTVEYEYLGDLETDLLSDRLPPGVEIKQFEETHLPAICAYDLALAGYDRKVILEASFKEANSTTLVAFKDDTCVGFGVVKKNIFNAAKVGPLYANHQDVAETMFKKLLEQMPEAEGLAMVTFSTNLAANRCVRRLGIQIHDNLLRLYTKERLAINTTKVFAQFDVDFAAF